MLRATFPPPPLSTTEGNFGRYSGAIFGAFWLGDPYPAADWRYNRPLTSQKSPPAWGIDFPPSAKEGGQFWS